jgi:hypothetical protein
MKSRKRLATITETDADLAGKDIAPVRQYPKILAVQSKILPYKRLEEYNYQIKDMCNCQIKNIQLTA